MPQSQSEESFAQALEESRSFRFVDGFIAGAKWWEYKKTGFTMWQGDQNTAETVAFARLAESDGGDVDQTNPNRFIAGFLEGAKWWEFHKYDRALSAEDQELVRSEATRRLENLPNSYRIP